MSEPFLGEIRVFAGNFAINGWAVCNGQLLPIAQNTALFSLLGTTYGGDGRTTFALPNFQGRAPMHWGPAGNGVSARGPGETGGTTSVTLDQSTLASHTHALKAFPRPATTGEPTGNALLAASTGGALYKSPSGAQTVTMAQQGVGPASGGGGPHNNMQPYLALTFLIALQGIFPPRS